VNVGPFIGVDLNQRQSVYLAVIMLTRWKINQTIYWQ